MAEDDYMREYFRQRRLNTKYGARNVANRLVLEALIPKFETKVSDIADIVVQVIDPLVDGFFKNLVQHMGREEDLLSQVPSIPNLAHWNGLTEDYLNRKGNDLFWSYTHSIDPQTLATRLKITRRTKGFKAAFQAVRGSALIPQLGRLNGLQVFGGATVRVRSSTVGEIVIGKHRPRPLRRTVPKTIEAISVTITIRVFSNITRAQIPTIETWLADNGYISDEDRRKLIGHDIAKRPLIRPFMAYYSSVLIPKMIADALAGRFPLAKNIRVAPP